MAGIVRSSLPWWVVIVDAPIRLQLSATDIEDRLAGVCLALAPKNATPRGLHARCGDRRPIPMQTVIDTQRTAPLDTLMLITSIS